MVLASRSRLVRWAYYLNDFGPPAQTSLCAFFWRAFVFMPLFWLLMTFVVFSILFVICSVVYRNPGTFTALVLIGAIIILALRKSRTISRAVDNSLYCLEQTVFWQGVKTVKGKFCPIIYFREE